MFGLSVGGLRAEGAGEESRANRPGARAEEGEGEAELTLFARGKGRDAGEERAEEGIATRIVVEGVGDDASCRRREGRLLDRGEWGGARHPER